MVNVWGVVGGQAVEAALVARGGEEAAVLQVR